MKVTRIFYFFFNLGQLTWCSVDFWVFKFIIGPTYCIGLIWSGPQVEHYYHICSELVKEWQINWTRLDTVIYLSNWKKIEDLIKYPTHIGLNNFFMGPFNLYFKIIKRFESSVWDLKWAPHARRYPISMGFVGTNSIAVIKFGLYRTWFIGRVK